MKTAAILIIALSGLVLSTIGGAEPRESHKQTVSVSLTPKTHGPSVSQTAATDSKPVVMECKAVCMLPPAGVHNTKL